MSVRTGMTFRNRRGEAVVPERMTATEAKNEFGKVIDSVIQGEFVVVTRHNAPRAVIMSIHDYEALAAAGRPDLDALSAEFDEMFDQMQTPRSKAAAKALFGLTRERLGKAAVDASSRSG